MFELALSVKRPDVILAEYAPAGVTVLKTALRKKIPVVVHCHGFDVWRQDILDEYGDDYRELFSRASLIVAVSREMQDQIIRLGAPEGRVVWNPYGVDGELFRDAKPSANPPVILAVGRLVEKKAPFFALRAFVSVRQIVPGAKFVWVGAGPLMAGCRRFVRENHLQDAVSFTGTVSHEKIIEYLRRARVFIQHSVTAENGDAEGTPVALLEASAAGLPVVGTRHQGIKEAVVHGETGFLTAEKDTARTADYLAEFLRNPSKADDFGRAGRRRVLTHYDERRSLETLGRILEKAVSES